LRKFKSPIQDFLATVLVFKPHILSRDNLVAFDSHQSEKVRNTRIVNLKANLHWGVARSNRARFFVCFIALRSCHAEPCTSAELPDATKQTKNRARLLLATPQYRLALTVTTIWMRFTWRVLLVCVRFLQPW